MTLIRVLIATVAGIVVLFLGLLGNERFAGQQQRRHAGRVFQGSADYFCGVDDTRLDEIFVTISDDVKTEV
jgi:hypothetical protein